jgi:hypothetical protein
VDFSLCPLGRLFKRVGKGPLRFQRGWAAPLELARAHPSLEQRLKQYLSNASRFAMPNSKELIERARIFEERADQARDPISRQHYREMAAHCRSLSVEHQKKRATSERELERAGIQRRVCD